MVLNKYAFSLTNSTAGTQGNLRKMTFNKNIMDIGENVAIPSISLMSYDETIVSNIIARNNLLLGPNTNFSADTTYLYLNDGRSLIYENSNSAPSSTLNDVYFYSPYKRDSIDIFFGSNSVFSSNTSLSILKSSNYSPIPPVENPSVNKKIVHLVDFTEAVDTINDPEGGYFYLQIDDDSYKIIKELDSPIEAGTFYKYNEGDFYTHPDFVIDNVGFKLSETSSSNFTVCSFPKSSFDLGTLYSSVVSTPVTNLNSPIIQPTIQALNLVQGENPPGTTFYGFTLWNGYLSFMYISGQLTGYYYQTLPIPDAILFYLDDKNVFELYDQIGIDEVVSFNEIN